LIPTPTLPLRALDQLASCNAPASIAALLVTWGNAYGPALVAETSRQKPDLFQIEHALVSTWATRARRAARRGDRAMRTFVERQLDLANLWTALLVAEHGFDGPPGSLFLEGGALIKRDALEQAAAAKSRSRAGDILDRLVRQSPLAAATGRDDNVEERVRRALTREQRAIARQQPLGTAAIIEFWLRLRGEAAAIRRIIWSIAAGVPATARALEPVKA
jgi:vacuolar-type H+-ATPase subunit C/Vma6